VKTCPLALKAACGISSKLESLLSWRQLAWLLCMGAATTWGSKWLLLDLNFGRCKWTTGN